MIITTVIACDKSDVLQPQSTRVIQLQRLRQQLLQPMKLIKNSTRCHLLNLSTANLCINRTQLSLPPPGTEPRTNALFPSPSLLPFLLSLHRLPLFLFLSSRPLVLPPFPFTSSSFPPCREQVLLKLARESEECFEPFSAWGLGRSPSRHSFRCSPRVNYLNVTAIVIWIFAYYLRKPLMR